MQSLSLDLLTRHEAERRPLPFMGRVKRDLSGKGHARTAPACYWRAQVRRRRSRRADLNDGPGQSVFMQGWQSRQLTFYPVRASVYADLATTIPYCCRLDAPGDGTLLWIGVFQPRKRPVTRPPGITPVWSRGSRGSEQGQSSRSARARSAVCVPVRQPWSDEYGLLRHLSVH